jgi:UDP-glucose-4-epimerase GalE
MRLLVTGGAGYVGGFTTRMLLRAGHDVTVIDDLSNGTRRAADGAELIVADITDVTAVRELMARLRPEAVLHFAALKSVAESWEQPERYQQVNVEGTRNLLAAMAEVGTRMMVFSGSCAIYGTPSRLPVDESCDPAPLNPYGRTKLDAEAELAAAERSSGVRSVALRYFNAAGAELDGSIGESLVGAANLVPVVMRTALGLQEQVEIFGRNHPTPDGTAIRDYVHVLDLAEAHLAALDYLAGGGGSAVANLGTGRGASVAQVITLAEAITGRAIPTHDAAARDGDAAAVWADATRARQLLGWQARYEIDDILRSAWAWHSSGGEDTGGGTAVR